MHCDITQCFSQAFLYTMYQIRCDPSSSLGRGLGTRLNSFCSDQISHAHDRPSQQHNFQHA